MPKRLFLLDGMALVYRAHFALARRPVLSSKGVNTSALYGFTQTVLEILANHQPTHLALAFDTAAPTQRHQDYPAYKIQRQAMPEDIVAALPQVRRMAAALNLPVLLLDGYEADDIIGTVVRQAAPAGFECYMVTPDKDFSQLVAPRTFLFKPGRAGDPPEVLGPAEVCEKWGIGQPHQIIDILGLWGDASDNIPGVPGIGEKTAIKLIGEYGSIENLLAHVDELKGKLRESLEQHREQALLSKRLATINCQVPIPIDLDRFKLRPPDEPALKQLLVEFEFNSIGRRLFGEEFKAGRGAERSGGEPPAPGASTATSGVASELGLRETAPADADAGGAALNRLSDVAHDYRVVTDPTERARVWVELGRAQAIGLAVQIDGSGLHRTKVLGLALASAPGKAWALPVPAGESAARSFWDEVRRVLENEAVGKSGHDLKRSMTGLGSHGISVRGDLFDVMLAHALIEPDLRHSLDYLSEALLGYAPIRPETGGANQTELTFVESPPIHWADSLMEQADLANRLRSRLEPLLEEKRQTRVFHEIEMPLIPVLIEMEREGIRVDAGALREFADQLSRQMAEQERAVQQLAGAEFNVNSPRQLGEILFDRLKLVERPKKTRTGQYATDEQTLLSLAVDHEIVRRLLDYRACSKLKSTYADALPAAINPDTGRIHTTYQQLAAATGRLSSQDPNLQNIPIRTEMGREIRKAFVPRDEEHRLLSADYSQIELRIIAALSREPGLLEAFRSDLDVHVATAARVFGVGLEAVTPEMRTQAKMVNYGIAYGISAFGLAQRLGIARSAAATIIEQYFAQFAGIRTFMDGTIAFAREHGYVETVTGRRRYVRDIRSANGTVRAAAERNAINAPIQGSAADMIKLAMIRIQGELNRRRLRSRMLLQVHDELVFDLFLPEQEELSALVEERMRTAMPLDVPIVVELGVGRNWLEAH
ncbi:MAG: DNA polymerase I [Verrucomicrobia bacterium]|nr:DNA polymerase I [Verrucomicrobiota bacterium]